MLSISQPLTLFLSLFVFLSCGEEKPNQDKDKDKDKDSPSNQNEDSSEQGNGSGAALSGVLNIDSATHVYAVAPESFDQKLVKVDENGTFELEIEEGKPYSLSFINSKKTGSDMVLGKFSSKSLDSVAAGDLEDKKISLGTLAVDASAGLTETGDPIVTSTSSHEDIVKNMGISEDAADTLGKADDAIGRYANPDIDANGKLDAEENADFRLDFHNRFSPVDDQDGQLDIEAMKNKFLPEHTTIKYTSTGIIPEFEVGPYLSKSNQYTWTFETNTTLHSTSCNSESLEGGDTLAAGTGCQINSESEFYDSKAAINVEKSPPTGKYTLTIGDTTFTWPNIKFNDLSSGAGFLAIFVRYDVDASDKLQSVSFQFRIKDDSGLYKLASQQAIDLLVKEDSGYVSLKVDGSTDAKSLGFNIPRQPESTVHLKDLSAGEIRGLDLSEITEGIDFDRVKENPGISYDDKLGMRFFF